MHTEESKRRIGAASALRRHSPETRAKMSAAQKGRPGKPQSAASRAKLSDGWREAHPPESWAAGIENLAAARNDPGVRAKRDAALRAYWEDADKRARGLAHLAEIRVKANNVRRIYDSPVQMVRAGQLRRHGLTLQDEADMLVVQGGCCALCGSDQPGGRGRHWNVDHDHETGRVRGLLCMNCNLALGHIERLFRERRLDEVIAYAGIRRIA